MRKTFLFKLLVSFALLLPSPAAASATCVSLIPSVTEIIYALGLESNLAGVSDKCNYPKEVDEKEKIGSLYGTNKEKILKIHPDYVLALSATKPFLSELERTTKIKFIYFDFDSVEDIFSAIRLTGKLFNAQNRADELVLDIKNKIKPQGSGKSILYVIQSKPLITIGKKSFLTDVIKLSGNVSATADVGGYYPSISLEYVIKLHPDYVVIGPYANISELKPFFKNSKFITMTKHQNDVINRPSPRVWESVNFFGGLK